MLVIDLTGEKRRASYYLSDFIPQLQDEFVDVCDHTGVKLSDCTIVCVGDYYQIKVVDSPKKAFRNRRFPSRQDAAEFVYKYLTALRERGEI